jgi:hypothetical protein
MHMDRAIFDLRISVEATSAYILICSLMDEGHFPSPKQIRLLWSGDEGSLRAALGELMERQVLVARGELFEDSPVSVNASDKWKWDLNKILQK